MALSYEFSIGSVRAREKQLLGKADIEQLLSMKDEADIITFLKDKGYPEGETVSEMLDLSKTKMWDYIRSVAPEMSVFEPFYLQNDIHNFKTILKGVMFKKEFSNFLIRPYTIEPEIMKNSIENRKFDKLPEWLAGAADKAYELLAHTKDARLSDAAVDRALMERVIIASKSLKSSFLEKYFNTFIFYANIKIALRASKAKTTMEYLDLALCECDGFDKDKTKKMIMSGPDNLIKYLEGISNYSCKIAVSLYKEKPSEFERFADNKLMMIAKEMCRLSNEGPEPLFGYYIGCEYERRTVSIISNGVRTNTPPEKIRERLRETYG